jgi:hypothetical protein
MDGTYGFVYCGSEDVGAGVFRITGSKLVGADINGGKYHGRIVKDEATGNVELQFEMTVPAGGVLVQGTSPQEMTYTKSDTVTLPYDFADGKPFEVHFAPGRVTLMMRRVPAERANGMTYHLPSIV